MVIDFEMSRLPSGLVGWARLLDAVENAHPGDENEYIEFKAGVDLTSGDGRFALAKAIVAFANRDPLTASKWLNGYAIVVIGLEPGNVPGTPGIDPADLHNKVNALLAPPAPGWDPTLIPYRGKNVIVIAVDPPRPGDPIACIGKSSGRAEDGQVFVRKVGKSDRARSSDLRRLSDRLCAAGAAIHGITVETLDPAVIPVLNYSESWIEGWLDREETRLLAPLHPSPTRPVSSNELERLGVSSKALADYTKQAKYVADLVASSGVFKRHEESRSEDQYREEVTEYLRRCEKALEEALDELRSTVAANITFVASNHTTANFEQVRVNLHIEGDVHGYGDVGRFENLIDFLPKPPRVWGPWTTSILGGYGASPLPNLGLRSAMTNHPPMPSPPGPTIVNGGSVDVTCVPLHLYPETTEVLVTVGLVAKPSSGDSVRVTWTASAKNVGGKLKGALVVPVAPDAVDANDQLSAHPT